MLIVLFSKITDKNILMIGPTAEGTNPGMRLYTYDGHSGTLLDYEQYGLDLKKLKLDYLTQQ